MQRRATRFRHRLHKSLWMSINQTIIARYPLICACNCKWHINPFLDAFSSAECVFVCNLSRVSLQQLNRNYFWFCNDDFSASSVMQISVSCSSTNSNDHRSSKWDSCIAMKRTDALCSMKRNTKFPKYFSMFLNAK